MRLRPLLTLLLTGLTCTVTRSQSEPGSLLGPLTPHACPVEGLRTEIEHSRIYTQLSLQIDALTAAQVAFTDVPREEVPRAWFLKERLLCAASIIRKFHVSSRSDRMFKRELLGAYLQNARAVGDYQAILDKHQAMGMSGYDRWTPADRVNARKSSELQAVASERLRSLADISLSQTTYGTQSWPSGKGTLSLTSSEAADLRSRLSEPLKGGPSVFSVTAQVLLESLNKYGCGGQ